MQLVSVKEHLGERMQGRIRDPIRNEQERFNCLICVESEWPTGETRIFGHESHAEIILSNTAGIIWSYKASAWYVTGSASRLALD
jgi:hypothetical protein